MRERAGGGGRQGEKGSGSCGVGGVKTRVGHDRIDILGVRALYNMERGVNDCVAQESFPLDWGMISISGTTYVRPHGIACILWRHKVVA